MNIQKNEATILDGIKNLIIPYCTQNYKDNVDSRLNQIIIRWICIKIRPKDIIRFLIGQFDFIMDQNKV